MRIYSRLVKINITIYTHSCHKENKRRALANLGFIGKKGNNNKSHEETNNYTL